MNDFGITSKLELNLSDPTVPLPFAATLASKHKMAAIVLYDPTLIVPLNQLRLSSNGRYKIILAVDFPYGANYVLEKFKQLPQEFLVDTVDGFDILLSSKTYNGTIPNEIEVRNEVKILRDFVQRFNKQLEVRFVVDAMTRDRELVENALKAIKTCPVTFIRLDHNLEMPSAKANLETISKAIERVKQHTPVPVKVSTNVTLELIKSLPSQSNRFDVSVKTAQKIIHELEHPVVVKKEEVPAVMAVPPASTVGPAVVTAAVPEVKNG